MRIALLLLLFSIAGAASAQVFLDRAELTYKVTRSPMNRSGKMQHRGMRQSIAFAPGLLRQETSYRPGASLFTVTDLGREEQVLYCTDGESFLKMEESYSPNLFELGLWSEAHLRTVLTSDTSRVGSRLCRKALLVGPVGDEADTLHVWYVPDTMLRSGAIPSLLAGVSGLLVRMVFREHPKVVIGTPRVSLAEWELIAFDAAPQRSPAHLPAAERYELLSCRNAAGRMAAVLAGR